MTRQWGRQPMNTMHWVHVQHQQVATQLSIGVPYLRYLAGKMHCCPGWLAGWMPNCSAATLLAAAAAAKPAASPGHLYSATLVPLCAMQLPVHLFIDLMCLAGWLNAALAGWLSCRCTAAAAAAAAASPGDLYSTTLVPLWAMPNLCVSTLMEVTPGSSSSSSRRTTRGRSARLQAAGAANG
jgi:hypothetical protein